jgi:hypothetical protein
VTLWALPTSAFERKGFPNKVMAPVLTMIYRDAHNHVNEGGTVPRRTNTRSLEMTVLDAFTSLRGCTYLQPIAHNSERYQSGHAIQTSSICLSLGRSESLPSHEISYNS